MIDQIVSAAFQFHFMALVVDTVGRRGLSNEMCHQLRLKKTKVTSLVNQTLLLCEALIDCRLYNL